MAFKKVCLHKGCPELVESGYCEAHRKDNQTSRKEYDANRPKWHDMYNSDRWRKARARHLRHNPLCVECLELGCVVPAKVVDHIEDHKGDYSLFWDESNWQSMCIKCHNSKTARENPRGQGGQNCF